MSNVNKRVIDFLLDSKAINEEQYNQISEICKNESRSEQDVILERSFTTEEILSEALSKKFDLPFVVLTGLAITQEILELFDTAVMRKYKVMPFDVTGGDSPSVHLAMADPMNVVAIEDIVILTKMRVEPFVATPTDIMNTLDRYFGTAETKAVAEEYAKEREKIIRAEEEAGNTDYVNNSPIVVIVNSMIEQAARQRASDIHIEALQDSVRVRYRIDGVLYNKVKYAYQLCPAIIARVKIISDLDISEKRKPQDGRITYVVDGKEYDIRVSILPTVFGEKCVMRLALKQNLSRDKKMLGFRDDELKKFDHILSYPNGIVLATGPTGSGKSTTLYTALSELNSEDVNIVTVEDPVEANIDGINQVQVNVKADMTFANGLRSILRQDPDIIMIGEIRDEETAMIAVQASITGHLVVSTVHTNSSANTVTRLLDMGVDSYLIADSVVGIIAQRLVRRLCPHCKKPYNALENELEFMKLPKDEKVQIYEPAGCQLCNNTGYYGRIGVYEIMEISPAIKVLITRKATAEEIKKKAVEEGMSTLRHSAAQLVLNGITSFKEMLTVSFED